MADSADWQAMRAKNLLDFKSIIDEELAAPEMVALKQELETIKKQAEKPAPRKTHRDKLFTFTGNIPTERRSSARLLNVKPKYKVEDLDEIEEKGHKDLDYFDEEDIEKVVFQPRKKRKFGMRRVAEVPFVAADEVTEEYINNIAWFVKKKKYSENGTSCHQCRQKTNDSKTYCRSGRCVGIRGQFCGVCLKNRYGEDAAVALRDPKWSCPPCRDLCNCSICRARKGKRPTGILAPIAHNHGFKSVADFLKHLQEQQHDIEPGDETVEYVEKELLGFDANGEPVLMS